MPDDDLSAAERRSESGRIAARARWDGLAHPLFPCERGEKPQPIAFINVRRYSNEGPIDAPRVWPADELQGDEDIFTLFGGGTYELIGRGALPNGTPGGKVTTRRLRLEGPSKPFHSEPIHAAATVTASGGGGGDRFDMFMAMMADDRREARAREERREAEQRAADERRQAREEAARTQTTTLLVNGLGVVASIVTAVLSRPAPAAPAPGPDLMPLLAKLIPTPDATDPLERIGKILEVAKQLHPEKSGESLPELLEGFGQAAQGIAQMEQMRIAAHQSGAMPGAAPMPGSMPPPPAAAAAANGHGPPPGVPPQPQLVDSDAGDIAS